MARKVIWSAQASRQKDKILEYWLNRNKSRAYPIKLNALFHKAVKIISRNPQLGRKTSEPDIRFKLVRDYFIFYRYLPNQIEVLVVWDVRQNPDQAPFIL